MTRADPEFLTVPELARLLRLKDRKIYDLAASGAVPCSRATGKLLFPTREIRAWIAQSSQGASALRPGVFLGSHDPLLEWALRQSQCGLATFFDGSSDGLDRMLAKEGIAAGLHLYDVENSSWNVTAVNARFNGENAVLVKFASRQRGLVLAKGLGQRVTCVADLAGLRFVPRQPQSGAAVLMDHLLECAGMSTDALTFAPAARSELDAVLAVSEVSADATLGLQTLARQFDLEFCPLVAESFDLLIDRKAYFEPPMQKFFAFCKTREFATKAKDGYDIAGLGTVLWNG